MTQFTCKGVKQINNRISLNMTFTFTIRISQRFSSAREFQMGNFQKYWSQNVGQDFIVLDFFSLAEDFESWREGRKGPSKSGEKCSRRKVHMYDVHFCMIFGRHVHFLFTSPFTENVTWLRRLFSWNMSFILLFSRYPIFKVIWKTNIVEFLD